MGFIEDFKKYNRDKNGFVVLDPLIEKNNRKISDTKNHMLFTNKNGNRYYYKIEGACSDLYKERLTSYNNYSGQFADNDAFLLSEVVNSRLVNMLGLYSPKCYLARIGKYKGIISQDYCNQYPAAFSLADYTQRYLHGLDNYLYASIETLTNSKNLSDNILNQLGLASLVYIGTAQADSNQENLAIYEGEKTEDDQVIMIDHANTRIAFSGEPRLVQRSYQKGNYNPVLNITDNTYEISDYYNDLVTSKYISKDTIERYLSNLEKVLHNNNFISDINAEVKEYCGLVVPREFMDMSKEVLYSTGEHIQNAYDKRKLLEESTTYDNSSK